MDAQTILLAVFAVIEANDMAKATTYLTDDSHLATRFHSQSARLIFWGYKVRW